MQTSTSLLQITLSPDTVYTTTAGGQYSFANLVLTITNTGDAAQVASVAILLPQNLYLENFLSSVSPSAGTAWNFSATSAPGEYQANPASPVTIAADGSVSFTLNNVTLAQQTGTASVQVVVKLSDGTHIPETFTVNIAQATASIASFTAEPTNILPNDSATLSWQCTGMSYCTLTPGNGAQLPATDSQQVLPEISTTYTLDAYATGLHLQAQVNVQVGWPQVVGFTPAGGLFTDYNTNVLFNWETVNADSVTLTTDPQLTVIPANLPTNTNGHPVPIGPLTQATGITLTPSAGNGTMGSGNTKTININPPAATFSASPDTNVWEQDKVTISWNITSAASVTIEPSLPGGPSLQNLSGSVVIQPTEDVSYTLTVTGAPGTVNAVKTIGFGVTKVAINSFSASPNPIMLNNPNQTALSWNTQAQVASIDQGIGSVPTTGSKTVNFPPSATIYTLTAGTSQNPALRTAQVMVLTLYGPYPFTGFSNANSGWNGVAPFIQGTNFNVMPYNTSINYIQFFDAEALLKFFTTPISGQYTVELSGVEVVSNNAGQPDPYVIIITAVNSEKTVFTLCGKFSSYNDPKVDITENYQWTNPNVQQGTITITGIYNQ